MPNVSRLTDLCTGHGGFPPRPVITLVSSDVFAENLACAHDGSLLAPHCNNSSCHTGSIIEQESTVFVNNEPLAHVLSPVDCGSLMLTGANTVFVYG